MNFSTFGPFRVSDPSKNSIDIFYKAINEVDPQLEKGIGVYLVSVRKADGTLLPCYVGRTFKGFGSRLINHFDKGKFSELMEKNHSVEIFLIARVTGKGKMIRSTEKIRAEGLKSIRLLEFLLIGSCLPKNAELLNKQESTFHRSMHVPGYWNSSVENYDDSAHQLAAMLNTKFGS